MGDTLHDISNFGDPIGAKLTGGKNDVFHDVLTPKQAAPATPYSGPIAGSQLYKPPASGAPGAPLQGATVNPGPTTGAAVTGGYTPNYWAAGGQAPASAVNAPTPGGPPAGGPGPQVRPPMSGAPGAGPPQMATGGQGPDMQRQMMMAQMLRGGVKA